MGNKSIFEIESEYMRVMDELEENGGEITEELQEVLIQNEEDFAKKAKAYVAIIKQKESDLLLIKDEMDRLTAKKKRVTKTNDKLKSILLDALTLYGQADKKGIMRYTAGTFDLATRKSTSCSINGEEELKAALVNNIVSVVGSGTVDKEVKDIEEGNLVIAYNPPDDTEYASTEDIPDTIPLNKVEADFLNSSLSYNIKLDIKYTEMLRIARAINEFVKDPGVYVDYGISIPKKEASTIVKSNKGFRIASNIEKKSLTIK